MTMVGLKSKALFGDIPICGLCCYFRLAGASDKLTRMFVAISGTMQS